MKKNTKLIAALFCLTTVLMFSLIACDNNTASTDSSNETLAENPSETSDDETGNASSVDPEVADGTMDAGLIGTAEQLPPADKKDGERKIGSTVIQTTHPFVQAWIQGVKDVVEGEHGDEYVVLGSEVDPMKQSQQVDDLVTSGCDGIVIEVLDGESLVNPIKKAYDAGVFVQASDSPIPEGGQPYIISEVMSDNYTGGQIVAQKMVDDIGGEGEIIFMYYPGTPSANREAGMNSILEKYPDIKIVGEGDHGCNIQKGNDLMQNLIQAHPNIKAVLSTCDDGAIGAMKALEAIKKLEGVGFYGFDATPDCVKLIGEGKFTASIRQDPYTMGKESAEDLYKAMTGEQLAEKLRYTPIQLVDASNTKDYAEYKLGE
jgi:ABC-type sugar transport system substrate-binding protein